MTEFPYQRVLVIGCPGAGKSTFARALQACTGLPICHLDLLFWRADKTTLSREEFLPKVREVLSTDRWIMDGNYSFSMAERLTRADAVFFFDLPAEMCLDGVRKRRNRPRPDMPWIETEEDAEFTAFIRTFGTERRPKILQLLAERPGIPVVTFHTRAEADAYLSGLKATQNETHFS
ncbi:MAG: adenylate kinase [Clostridia bacterium]|nr:adenylate kinase [Clostridia bacterium]